MRYSSNRRFSVFQRGSAWASHVPKIDLSYDKLFFSVNILFTSVRL